MKKSTANITTLVAVGGTLVAMPAAALELGEAKVNSSLGQPLRASVAYALAPNETISNTCVSVQGNSRGAVPDIGRTTISIANGIISVTGKSAVREPIITLRLNVQCPYAGRITREYTLFVDPVFIAEQVAVAQVAQTAPASSTTVTQAPAATTARTPDPSRVVRTDPVVTGTRYQVAPGETLGDIAARIVDRPVGLWPAVQGIFAANPDAFVNNDVNRLKAGSTMIIPDFGADAPLAVAPAAPAEPNYDFDAPEFDENAGSVYTGETAEQSTLPTEFGDTTPDFMEVPDPTAVLEASESAFEPDAATLEQSLETQEETVEAVPEPVAEVENIPATELPAPEITAESPNVATASVRPTRVVEPEPTTNWLMWLGGAGVGLIALLLFFGRMVKNRFGSSPIGTIEPQERRKPDNNKSLEVISEMEVTEIGAAPTIADDAADEEAASIDDLEETQENLALDADLIIGSGLKESDEVDVAQDFGFAATTQLDHEFTAEMAEASADADPGNTAETDIIPPLNIEPQSILESEVLPDEAKEDEEGDDYDMSVIVDATKVPNPEDATIRDLEAVPVETDDDTLVSGDYTVSSEVDYTVLEQDYEDELTATQALNEEIARAAEELADSMDGGADISMASVAALDATAQVPADNDDTFIGDTDDTSVNSAIDDQVDDGDVTAKFRSQKDQAG